MKLSRQLRADSVECAKRAKEAAKYSHIQSGTPSAEDWSRWSRLAASEADRQAARGR